MQISTKEREVLLETKFKEIANVISGKIVHPVTKRQFPVDSIETSMKSIKFKVKMDADTKKQAVECIKMLVKKFKVERARMLIRLTVENAQRAQIAELLEIWAEGYKELAAVNKQAQGDEGASNVVFEAVIEPRRVREITTTLEQDFKNKAVFEIVEHAIMNKTVRNTVITILTHSSSLRIDLKSPRSEIWTMSTSSSPGAQTAQTTATTTKTTKRSSRIRTRSSPRCRSTKI